jgi:hypothetical protein
LEGEDIGRMNARATTDKAGRMSIVILFVQGHEPIHLEPAEALEFAAAINQAGDQAAKERAAGPAPIPERRKPATV